MDEIDDQQMRRPEVLHQSSGPRLELPPEAWNPRVQMAGFYVFRSPARPRYRVLGLHLLLVTQGALHFAKVDGRECVAHAGEMVWFGDGVNQWATAPTGSVALYQLHCFLAGDDLRTAVPSVPGCGPLPDCFAVGAFLEALMAAWDRLIRALLQASALWQVETRIWTLEILRLAAAAAFADAIPAGPPLDPWRRLLARLEVLDAHCRVEDLAREAGLRPESFIRAFRRHTGTTPKQYLLQRRLSEAHRLLCAGASVKQAAQRCGFPDPLYFSRLFRRCYGHPPSLASATPTADHPGQAIGLPISRHVFAPGYEMAQFMA